MCVSLNGKVEPLGKISDFDIIIDELAEQLYQKKAL